MVPYYVFEHPIQPEFPACMRTQVHRMVRLANSRAAEVMAGLKSVLQSHDSARVAARVRRHSGALAHPSQGGRSVTVLASSDIAGVRPCTLAACARSSNSCVLGAWLLSATPEGVGHTMQVQWQGRQRLWMQALSGMACQKAAVKGMTKRKTAMRWTPQRVWIWEGMVLSFKVTYARIIKVNNADFHVLWATWWCLIVEGKCPHMGGLVGLVTCRAGATPLRQPQQTAVAGTAAAGKARVTAVGLQALSKRDLLSTAGITGGKACTCQ